MPGANAFSYEQTVVLRRAVAIVLAPNNATTEKYRHDVARVVLDLANDNAYDDPHELAKLALAKLRARRTG
jgi:hypothetical protein